VPQQGNTSDNNDNFSFDLSLLKKVKEAVNRNTAVQNATDDLRLGWLSLYESALGAYPKSGKWAFSQLWQGFQAESRTMLETIAKSESVF
jgi:hypothetical protein